MCTILAPVGISVMLAITNVVARNLDYPTSPIDSYDILSNSTFAKIVSTPAYVFYIGYQLHVTELLTYLSIN